MYRNVIHVQYFCLVFVCNFDMNANFVWLVEMKIIGHEMEREKHFGDFLAPKMQFSIDGSEAKPEGKRLVADETNFLYLTEIDVRRNFG